jgi:hypothetical protein
MAREQIPDDVQRFILVSVPSVPYLEAMLLLRNEVEQAWNGAHLARRLYMSEKAAAELLSDLHAAGVLRQTVEDTPSYRYQPSTGELREIIDRVAESYARQLVDITNLIHSKTSKKAQQFADAFKWRKDS